MIQVLDKAFEILKTIANSQKSPAKLSHIAQTTKINAPTCTRILKSMLELGIVEQSGPRQGYNLGPELYALTANGTYRNDLKMKTADFLQELSDTIHETVILAVLHGSKRIILNQFESMQTLQAHPPQSPKYLNPLKTATGKLLLAFSDSKTTSRVLQTYSDSAENHNKFFAEIIDKGFAAIKTIDGVTGLAFPVKQNTEIVAALGIYLPTFRFTDENRNFIFNRVNITLKSIEERLNDI